MGYLDEAGLTALVGKVKGQVVELTSAEYEQLPESKNTDNKLYFVKDGAYTYKVDNEPTANSNGLVKSGGVYNWTSKIGSGTLTTTAKTLIPAVNELNNGLKPKELAYTATAGTNINLRRFSVYRSNSVVRTCVYFDVTSTIPNNGTIVSLDKALPRPLGQYSTSAVRPAAGGTGMGLVSIENANPTEVRAWGSLATGSYYFADFVYLTED